MAKKIKFTVTMYKTKGLVKCAKNNRRLVSFLSPEMFYLYAHNYCINSFLFYQVVFMYLCSSIILRNVLVLRTSSSYFDIDTLFCSFLLYIAIFN